MRRVTELAQLLGPVLVLVLVGVVGSMSFVDAALANEFRGALVSVAIVVALYVFVGNSGVISFGHVSFVAVGAFAAGVMTIPVELKPTITPGLFSLLGEHSVGNVASLALAAVAGGVFALLVGIPLMRLSGLSAGIATFAVLGVTYNIFNNWTKIGPGPLTLTTVPETTDFVQATAGAVGVVTIAFLYQRSRLGRKLRAAREDPAAARATGIDIHRERLWSFALSGALSGFAGGLLVHLAGTLQARDVYLDLTFLTLAMLVVGGVGSLWGGRRRGSRGERAGHVPPQGRERRDRLRRRHARQAALGRQPSRGRRRVHGDRPRRSPERADARPGVPTSQIRAWLRSRRGAWSMNTRVCVIGAGTIGGLFAGHLAQVADVSILTRRGAHADALNERGLRITGRSDLEAPVFASADPARLPPFDLGIVACKGTDLDAVASALEGRYPEATLMTVQNGLGAEEIVRRHGPWQLVSAITFMSGTRHSDTEVEYVLDTPTWLGPYEDTPFERVEEVTALITSSGLKAEAFLDLRPAQWSKLIFNATVNGVAALTRLAHDSHFAAADAPTDLGHLVRAAHG